jgi:excisionase family DNA binding protein
LEDLLERIIEEAAERASEKVLARLAQPTNPTSPYLSTAEAATYLCCKPQRVHDLLSSGKLQRFKDGSRTLVSRSELEAYVCSTGVAP